MTSRLVLAAVATLGLTMPSTADAGADVHTFDQAGRCTLTFTVTTGPAAHSVLIAQQSLA